MSTKVKGKIFTILFLYQDNAFHFVDEIYKFKSIVEDETKNLNNSGSTSGKRYEPPKPKKRKQNSVPRRSILSTSSTHKYNLLNFLVTLLAGISRSVYVLINKTRKDNLFMHSFDFVPFFTNTPVNETNKYSFGWIF